MQKRNKRGQTALFVILGLIIIGTVILLLIFRPQIIQPRMTEEEAKKFVASQIEPIKDYVRGCTKPSLKEGIILVGIQGGYYDPIEYVQLGEYKVAYDCIKKDSIYMNKLPLFSRIGDEIIEYASQNEVKKEIDSCIGNFGSFKREGLNIEAGERKIVYKGYTERELIFSIEHQITVIKGGTRTSIPEIPLVIKSGLGAAYNIATEIVNEECSGRTFDIDSYTKDNPPKARIYPQLDEENLFFRIITIPEEDEDPYHFHFFIRK